MNFRKGLLSLLPNLLFVFILNSAFSQSNEGRQFSELDQDYLNWYNLHPKYDGIEGAAVDNVYNELISTKQAKKKIIVAVIDGGVDIEHEDLQGKIWTNQNEIAGNNIDDDGNGYVDDIHGWNFIGNKKGKNIKYENYEFVRIYRDLIPKYGQLNSEDSIRLSGNKEYQLFLRCRQEYQNRTERYHRSKESNDKVIKKLAKAKRVLDDYFDNNDYSQSDVESIETNNTEVNKAKQFMVFLYNQGYTEASFARQVERPIVQLTYHLNLDFKPRDIIGDDPSDISDIDYGNKDVKGEESTHGTFVAGIIAAERNNDLGINGIADSVEIMALRTVPVGDEMDKDVALSIRYAVDNGAHIINMSFGKGFSPEAKMVHDAIQYASDQGVLLVHAAGNEALNTDFELRYPNDKINDSVMAENWIEVGASSKKMGKKFCGIFTNYGQENVDIFAPGVDIFSLYPENTYQIASGTSFAAPVFSGVAALLWSHYPQLSATELKKILLSSGTDYSRKKVYRPGAGFAEKDKMRFEELCASGALLNAFNAFLLAEELTIEKQARNQKPN